MLVLVLVCVCFAFFDVDDLRLFWVRHSVGRPAPATSLDLKASAFDPKEKLWTKFPSEGSKYTPPHQSVEFKWKDYCPVVFRLESVLSLVCVLEFREENNDVCLV